MLHGAFLFVGSAGGDAFGWAGLPITSGQLPSAPACRQASARLMAGGCLGRPSILHTQPPVVLGETMIRESISHRHSRLVQASHVFREALIYFMWE